MRTPLALATGSTLALGLAVAAVGCQTYDFEPVVPLALSQQTYSKSITAVVLKPTLMLVQDTSGSMNESSDPSNSNCNPPNGCGGSGQPVCGPSCPTRISELRSAMNTFLTTSGTVGRMGLISFPLQGASSSCAFPTQSDISVQVASADDNTTLQNAANAINGVVQTIVPAGGTPTSATLAGLATYPPLLDNRRQNFILLLTDGEPNCDANNPNNCTMPDTVCKCTLGPGKCGNSTGVPSCTLGCNDADATSGTITSLKQNQNIKTIVVGFGAEAGGTGGTGYAPASLTQMALAGGFPLSCPGGTDTECGTGNTCNKTNGICTRPYFQASSATQLAATLAQISNAIATQNPCQQLLIQPPSDPRFISVLINGTDTPSGADSWHYDSSKQSVIFTGSLCAQLSSSTLQNPVKVEYRVVQSQ